MDIKKPDLSVILEKLGFLRNNLALLVPIVLVVVAGLLFIPTTLFSRSLDKKIQSESVSKGDRLDRLMQNGVVAEDQYLTVKQELEGNAQDANEMKRLNKECVERSLLSYRIFPKPKDMASQKYEDFANAFCGGILDMIRGSKGTVPPTPEDLGMDAGMMGLGAGGSGGMGRNLYGRGAEGMMGRGGMTGRDTMMRGGAGVGVGAMEDFAKQARDIQDAVCSDKALSGAVYITPADISGYDFWSTYVYNTGRDEAIKTCWIWQHGYWIVEDVFQTLAQCNQGSDTVFSSPVKRLVSLKYEQDLSLDMAGGRGMGRGMDMGYPMRSMGGGFQNQNMPKFVKTGSQSLATPPTARYTNDEYNIIHFNVSVVVEASYQVEFMKALCSEKKHTFTGFDGDQPEQTFKHNQITILAIQTKPVVRKDMTHIFYRYGEDAVVELSLTCEYLLPKAGYADLVPEVLKESTEETLL
ncbi:MAG: hypothetical protein K9N55_03560 [Phycisphaerae bacterium]|nr:hypothetical protein [Phycisphaerae bacterium]